MKCHNIHFEGKVESSLCKFIDFLPDLLWSHGQILARDSLNGLILIKHYSLHLFLLLLVLFLLFSLQFIGLYSLFYRVFYG